MAEEEDPSKEKRIDLEKEQEFRFEVEFDSKVQIKLIEGTAECFGTELAEQQTYTFVGTKSAIFTWHGCTLEVTGPCHSYIAEETPMITYLNVHLALEDLQNNAKKNQIQGPRVMLVGPVDSGKSSLCKMLLNWSARKGFPPLFADLDIGQGAITVPGMFAAVPIDKPVSVGQHELSTSAPLVYFYGHVTPSDNSALYKLSLENLARDIDLKLEKDEKVRYSGVVMNTCGWVDGLGYQLLVHSIKTMKAVLDNERLLSDLNREFKKTDKRIIKLAKSGGVVTRNTLFRRKTRSQKIREYFYGPSGDLCPHSTVVDFRDIVIYKVGGGPQAPASALPIGAQSTVNPVRLVQVEPTLDLLHSVLGVSHSKTSEGILDTNLAGFLYVTEVNVERSKVTFLAPSPGPLPSKYLVLGSLKWLE